MNGFSRRGFLAASAVSLASSTTTFVTGADSRPESFAREVGVTTASFVPHLSANPQGEQFTLLELPRLMREELGMRVIDLNTSSLASLEPEYLDRVRMEAERHGCSLTNLKMNYSRLDMSSSDALVRVQAVAQYKRALDAGKRLGVRWARALPLKDRPDMDRYIASFQDLADYARNCGIQMVVENYGWMEADIDSVPQLIRAIGRNVAASPDIGNWTRNELRFAGLAKMFPLAVTCDFKAVGEIGNSGEHPLYDLRRCFQIGWDAGFRGPWCIEHVNRDRTRLFHELKLLRDMLRQWMAASS